MYYMVNNKDLIVVGAGLFGMTIAQRAAEIGKKVLIIDKRNHIGGNAYSYFDRRTGIEIHKYGAHLFHTSNKVVWDYVNRFTSFNNYVHKVYTVHNSEVFPMPINLGTINQFFKSNYSPDEAKDLIESQAKEYKNVKPKNLNEQGKKLIGEPLFNAFIKNYTQKQWQTDADKLNPSIIMRLPVRYYYDNRYFNDTYEGLPVDGYEKWFRKMLKSPNIEVQLNVDFFDNTQPLNKDALKDKVPIVYTGPIDKYFAYSKGELSWRTVDFEFEMHLTDDFQGTSVMNYADLYVPYTRIIEFRHFNPEREQKQTIIAKEFSRFAGKEDAPYYPINTEKDRAIFAEYQKLASQEHKVIFGGRLGEYKYFDMHQVIANAIKCFDNKLRDFLV
jgi:UDP-galactopyranose mutase